MINRRCSDCGRTMPMYHNAWRCYDCAMRRRIEYDRRRYRRFKAMEKAGFSPGS